MYAIQGTLSLHIADILIKFLARGKVVYLQDKLGILENEALDERGVSSIILYVISFFSLREKSKVKALVSTL
jgi:hypothetical protein